MVVNYAALIGSTASQVSRDFSLGKAKREQYEAEAKLNNAQSDAVESQQRNIQVQQDIYNLKNTLSDQIANRALNDFSKTKDPSLLNQAREVIGRVGNKDYPFLDYVNYMTVSRDSPEMNRLLEKQGLLSQEQKDEFFKLNGEGADYAAGVTSSGNLELVGDVLKEKTGFAGYIGAIKTQENIARWNVAKSKYGLEGDLTEKQNATLNRVVGNDNYADTFQQLSNPSEYNEQKNKEDVISDIKEKYPNLSDTQAEIFANGVSTGDYEGVFIALSQQYPNDPMIQAMLGLKEGKAAAGRKPNNLQEKQAFVNEIKNKVNQAFPNLDFDDPKVIDNLTKEDYDTLGKIAIDYKIAFTPTTDEKKLIKNSGLITRALDESSSGITDKDTGVFDSFLNNITQKFDKPFYDSGVVNEGNIAKIAYASLANLKRLGQAGTAVNRAEFARFKEELPDLYSNFPVFMKGILNAIQEEIVRIESFGSTNPSYLKVALFGRNLKTLQEAEKGAKKAIDDYLSYNKKGERIKDEKEQERQKNVRGRLGVKFN